MHRGAKPTKVKVEAGPSVTTKSRKIGAPTGGQLEERLTEAVEQQAATSEILHAISSSPTELGPVFRMILANAIRLCGASVATLWLFDGEFLSSVAHENASPEFAAYLSRARIRPGRETTTRRAALEQKTVQVADLLTDPDYSPPEFQRKEKVRTVLSVPLLRKHALVGVVTLWRRVVHPFTDRQVALVETFADQAVIAIENVRLFNETKEALEQQTATSEILRVISSSRTDVQPVFDTIAANAVRLCNARFSTVFRFDGEFIHIAAFRNLTSEGTAAFHNAYPCPPHRGGPTQRAILTRSIVHMPDVLKDPEFVYPEAAKRANFRSVLSVPMLRDGQPTGAISVFRAEAAPFPDTHIELLKTFADQAVVAIENVRLFTELEARTTQLTRSVRELKALGEVGQAVSSTLDLETVLRTIVSRATQLAGMDSGSIYEYDERREDGPARPEWLRAGRSGHNRRRACVAHKEGRGRAGADGDHR